MTQDSDGFLDEANASVVAARLAAIVESSDDIIVGKTLDGIITSGILQLNEYLGMPPAKQSANTSGSSSRLTDGLKRTTSSRVFDAARKLNISKPCDAPRMGGY